MHKAILTLALLVGPAFAETVHFAPNGKTYHAAEKCATLARSKEVLHADKADAAKHGLKPCGLCYRVKADAKSKPAKNAWAVSK